MIKVTVQYPELEDIDFDDQAMREAAEDAARAKMRRRGLAKGANLIGARDAAVDGAEKEAAKQLNSKDVVRARQNRVQ